MKKHFNIRLEENLIQNLKEKAKQNNTTPTALITRWAEQYCNDIVTTSNDENSDPYKTYSNDVATTSQLKSAIADLQSRLTQLENDSNDKVTTNYLDQRLAQALEPLWETLDYLSFSNDIVKTSDDIPNKRDSDDETTTSNDKEESNVQAVTTSNYSKDTARVEQPRISNDSDNNATTKSLKTSVTTKTTSDDIPFNKDSDDKATTTNDKEGSNIQIATTSNYSNDETTTEQIPSIFPTESKEGKNEEFSLQQTETPQKPNVDEQLKYSWDKHERADKSHQSIPSEDTQDAASEASNPAPDASPSNDDDLSGWMNERQMVKWLFEKGYKIGKDSLSKRAKRITGDGEKEFTVNGIKFRQRTDEKGSKRYCCLSLEKS